MLRSVTLTGADDTVSVDNLLRLQEKYPFVEWGILVSQSYQGLLAPRFPSYPWVDNVRYLAVLGRLNLSLHVCGRWVRDMLMGGSTLPYNYVDGFNRIQLNFHHENAPCRIDGLSACVRYYGDYAPHARRQFIFQLDSTNGNKHFFDLHQYWEGGEALNAVPLFDVSGGKGALPPFWPSAVHRADGKLMYHGYAGGLGPHNLEEQLPKIAEAAKDADYWIDMETHVRSLDDKTFDVDKAEAALEICAKWVSK